MSNFRSGDNNGRDAWKKMSEWSHSVPDDELNELFIDQDEWDEWDEADLLPPLTRGKKMQKFIAGLFGLGMIGTIFSVSAYQLAKVLGVDNFTFRDAVIATVCLSVIRYTDAGVMKQIR
jgi:hypothetical protein